MEPSTTTTSDRAASRRSSLGGYHQSLTAPSRASSTANPHSSTNSITSSEAQFDGHSMRSSLEGALNKLTHRSSEDEGGGTRKRMSKIFKGRRHRRKSLAPDDERSPRVEAEEVPPMPEVVPLDDPFQQSQESLGLHKSVASSLVTEDSDSELPPVAIRPSISPHQSHAGYLTLSSPLITSEVVDSTTSTTDTLVDSATSVQESPGSKLTQSPDGSSNTKFAPFPIGKLKEAFSPTRKSPQRPREEAESPRPGTSGSGFGAFFGSVGKGSSTRRGSKTADEPAQIYQSPEQIHDSGENESTSSLPYLAPRRIVTTIPGTPQNLSDAPTTFVTPPTPTDTKPPSPTEQSFSSKSARQHAALQSNPNIVVSPSGSMISHRRVRSATNPPSKLSNSISAPLSPTIEETKTPGGTLTNSAGGFFSSVFSAAQNAANNLGTTIANTTSNSKTKGNTTQQNTEANRGDIGGEEVIGPENADISIDNTESEKKQLAVETLGSGNLSLAHLGISDESEASPMSSAADLSMATDQASAQAEDIAAAEAVTAAYAAEKSPNSDDLGRSRSLTNRSDPAASPSGQTTGLDSPGTSVQRTGSIRSRISEGRRRRHRGSSVTTSNTIAAVIGSSTSALVPGAGLVSGQRLNGTGFAVASPKRNRDFHSLFKSVPEDDYLIEDYSAALQREILLHGRLYVSEGHLCFSSNILGWVTNLVISFDEVVSVEKKSTAVVFPNAIVIQTLHARNVFASLLSRDSTYDLIIGIWKISHPNLKSSLNGVTLEGSATGDKTEKAESIASDDGSDEDSDDDVYDEDAEEDEGMSFTEAGEGSFVGSEAGSVAGDPRKVSAAVAAAIGSGTTKTTNLAEDIANGASSSQDFPGPATHAPTDCGDADNHYDKLLIDTMIQAPLGKVYSFMFGPASGVFMRKWLIEDQKSTELQMDDDKKGLGEDRKSFSFSYVKPLGGGIGPKQTRCMIDMTLEQFDLEKVVTVLCSTQTPDVPSGNVFLTKTRYCLSWGPGNSTRLLMTFTVEWSGKSWLKGPIEKGANDGQLSYATALATALRAVVTPKPSRPTRGPKSRRRGKAQTTEDSTPEPLVSQPAVKAKVSDWGLLDPIRMLLGPLADPIEMLFSTQVLIAVLISLVMWLYFFRTPTPSALALPHQLSISTPQRLAAYEQIWRAEENELWKWLDDRIAMDQTADFVKAGQSVINKQKQKRDMAERLKDDPASKSMTEREIDEAIRVTEGRLEAMKRAVLQKRGAREGEKGEAEGGAEGVKS